MARYYAGCKNADAIETLAQRRALEAYRLDPQEWGVNMQALSGSPANLYVFWAIDGTNTRILSPHLMDGGHLSHGYRTLNKHVSATSDYF